MPDFMTRVCGFCGVQAQGWNAVVQPTSQNTDNQPPGSGWHMHSGPSRGMGFSDTDYYCSDECLHRRVILREQPTREPLAHEKNWEKKVQDNRPASANKLPPGRGK